MTFTQSAQSAQNERYQIAAPLSVGHKKSRLRTTLIVARSRLLVGFAAIEDSLAVAPFKRRK